jgi:hypothetical protein
MALMRMGVRHMQMLDLRRRRRRSDRNTRYGPHVVIIAQTVRHGRQRAGTNRRSGSSPNSACTNSAVPDLSIGRMCDQQRHGHTEENTAQHFSLP